MAPTSPFDTFGLIFHQANGMVVLPYLIGTIAMVCTALGYAQMARTYPSAGSVYAYAAGGIGPLAGFLAGGAVFLDYVLLPALNYLFAGQAMTSFVPGVPVWLWLAAFIVINTVINLLGIELTALTNRWLLAIQMLVIAAFFVLGATKVEHFSWQPLLNPEQLDFRAIFPAVSLAMYAFLGFDAISTLSEEAKGGPRQIGRATVLSLLLITVIFVAQVWLAALLVPGPRELLADGDPEGTAFYRAAGVAGGQGLVIAAALTTALTGGIAGGVLSQAACARLLFAVSRDGLLPRLLSSVDSRRGVPIPATVLVAIICACVGLPLSLVEDGTTLLSSMVNFGALCGFLLLQVAVLNQFLRRERSRDLLRHLVVPLLGMAVLGYMVITMNAQAQVIGLVWLGLLVVVWLLRRPRLLHVG
ncbi:APC family permease [Pseudonocardiaceae bacterium YIM PH 21723]|nr:APC family permease [Pseudonocardiaceae bacterium YIM PH 21723]